MQEYVVENVPGKKKFPVVMEAMTKLPDYYVHVACPVKTSTWLPQKRDRLIILHTRQNHGQVSSNNNDGSKRQRNVNEVIHTPFAK